jgi:DNA-binding transcriptional MerR regulator
MKMVLIGETAKECGVTITQLRYWSDSGLIRFESTTSGRKFHEADFPIIRKVRDFFDLGRKMGIRKSCEDARTELHLNEIEYIDLISKPDTGIQEDVFDRFELAVKEVIHQELGQGQMMDFFKQLGQEFKELKNENAEVKAELASIQEKQAAAAHEIKEELQLVNKNLELRADRTDQLLRELKEAREKKRKWWPF